MWRLIKRCIELNIENMRLSSAEILSTLLASIAFYCTALAIAVASMGFLTVGLVNLLAAIFSFYQAFIILSIFYALLLAVVYLLRKHLFYNPIARFVSRLIVKPPQNDET